MTAADDVDDQIDQLARDVHLLLRNRHPEIVGGVLALLTAMHFASHPPEHRNAALDWFADMLDSYEDQLNELRGTRQ